MDNGSSAAFLSYVHSDDEHDGGRITRLRERLEGEIRMHLGVPFRIFQDRNDLEWGQNWAERIDASLNAVTFLIPVVTPSFFKSPACRKEFDNFANREQALGTSRLILPIYYLDCDEMEDENSDKIAELLKTRQWSDWRPLRFFDLRGPEVSAHLASQAIMIKRARKELESVFSDAPTSKLDDLISARHTVAGTHHLLIQDGAIDAQEQVTVKPVQKVVRRKTQIKQRQYKYNAYTTMFDEVVQAKELLTERQTIKLGTQIVEYIDELQNANANALKEFEELLSTDGRLAVTILVDNSGSLRGGKIAATAAWSVLLVEVLDRAGWQTELLGFTTRSWKGGLSREKWLADGRPPSPGRLADLRHIIYKSFDESTVGFAQSVGAMLNQGLLKENIDGEAIQWASKRISAVGADRRIILVLSDGAPVDDSTLTVNGGSYLEGHLKHVLKETKKSHIEVIAIGIEHEVGRYYGEKSATAKAEALGMEALKLISTVVNSKL